MIVFIHAGAEGVGQEHTPLGEEYHLGEPRGDTRAFAHAAVDAGADLVLGSGPHVLRGIELYRGRVLAYSLGNLAAMLNPLIVAYSVQWFGSWNVPLYLMGVLFLVGAASWLVVDPQRPVFATE